MFEYIREFQQNSDIPVIMGEWGNSETLTIDERVDQARYILTRAKALGVPCFWWELGWNDYEEGTENCYGLYDRRKMEWHWPQLMEACNLSAFHIICKWIYGIFILNIDHLPVGRFLYMLTEMGNVLSVGRRL